jgi:hypothetical protein
VTYGLVFLLAVAFEVLYVGWIAAVTDGEALRAGLLAGVVVFISLVNVRYVVLDWDNLIPAALGHGLGSYIEVRRRRAATICNP